MSANDNDTGRTSPTVIVAPTTSGRDKADRLGKKFADAKRNNRSRFAPSRSAESPYNVLTSPSKNDPVKLSRLYSIMNSKRSTNNKSKRQREEPALQRSASDISQAQVSTDENASIPQDALVTRSQPAIATPNIVDDPSTTDPRAGEQSGPSPNKSMESKSQSQSKALQTAPNGNSQSTPTKGSQPSPSQFGSNNTHLAPGQRHLRISKQAFEKNIAQISDNISTFQAVVRNPARTSHTDQQSSAEKTPKEPAVPTPQTPTRQAGSRDAAGNQTGSDKKVLFSGNVDKSPIASSPIKEPYEPRSILKVSPPKADLPRSVGGDIDEEFPAGSLMQREPNDPTSIELIRKCYRLLQKEDNPRRFEILATLHNTLKINSVEFNTRELNKADVSSIAKVACAEIARAYVSPDMDFDAVESRTTILGVKLITTVMSMFEVSQTAEIVEMLCTLVLRKRISKAMASAFVQFCKEQSCILPGGSSEMAINALMTMPFYPSGTIVHEKILALKKIGSNAPASMLKTCNKWFPFILASIMSIDLGSHQRILQAVVALLNEWTSNCNPKIREDVLTLMSEDAETFLSLHAVEASQNLLEPGLSVCDLLVKTLNITLRRGAYVEAMKIWALVTYSISAFTWNKGIEDWPHLEAWVSVFTECFNADGLPPKIAALEAWKGIIFAYQSSMVYRASLSPKTKSEEELIDVKFHVLAHPFFGLALKLNDTLFVEYQKLFVRIYHSLYKFLTRNPQDEGASMNGAIKWICTILGQFFLAESRSAEQLEFAINFFEQMLTSNPSKPDLAQTKLQKDCFADDIAIDSLSVPPINTLWVATSPDQFVELLKIACKSKIPVAKKLKLITLFVRGLRTGLSPSSVAFTRLTEPVIAIFLDTFSEVEQDCAELGNLEEIERVLSDFFQAIDILNSLYLWGETKSVFTVVSQWLRKLDDKNAQHGSNLVAGYLDKIFSLDVNRYVQACNELLTHCQGFEKLVTDSLVAHVCSAYFNASPVVWTSIFEKLGESIYIDILSRLVLNEVGHDSAIDAQKHDKFWQATKLKTVSDEQLYVLYDVLLSCPGTELLRYQVSNCLLNGKPTLYLPVVNRVLKRIIDQGQCPQEELQLFLRKRSSLIHHNAAGCNMFLGKTIKLVSRLQSMIEGVPETQSSSQSSNAKSETEKPHKNGTKETPIPSVQQQLEPEPNRPQKDAVQGAQTKQSGPEKSEQQESQTQEPERQDSSATGTSTELTTFVLRSDDEEEEEQPIDKSGTTSEQPVATSSPQRAADQPASKPVIPQSSQVSSPIVGISPTQVPMLPKATPQKASETSERAKNQPSAQPHNVSPVPATSGLPSATPLSRAAVPPALEVSATAPRELPSNHGEISEKQPSVSRTQTSPPAVEQSTPSQQTPFGQSSIPPFREPAERSFFGQDTSQFLPPFPPMPYYGYPYYPMMPPATGIAEKPPHMHHMPMYYPMPYPWPAPLPGPEKALDAKDPENWVKLEELVTRLARENPDGVDDLEETKKRKLEDDLFTLLTCLKKRR
ncbi:hypothetical protein KL918_002010 [Ogataea parapolymorpha]|uniref:Telomere-associated protein Rif1 N-terminal domain-containing protein n=1 Tax=Ogataea parapolymorpha (strain ATCC 26012 / BCRC 20466 / JCM 22074 / NRRL Y-7560 / DL-1) TaxID=871575 RepID=W1QFB8_OGAPD|nr:hypothetical protein HPODL_04218 [Ogataea parapolymorpha DL-1]ESW98598.1 hypothetical protein HPODL_04218 [Ogataea parapolymorpha DL-1]KAG7868352.1 hypothetical protein KL918_002010 [Ogataea parapolymorpha]KAG7871424.1 hypothetical protein KL916_004004 [Ogataea parapolymorpha]